MAEEYRTITRKELDKLSMNILIGVFPIGLLAGVAIGFTVGFQIADYKYFSRTIKDNQIVLREDLNQDGLHPDASFINDHGKYTPLFLVKDEQGERYVTAKKMKRLFPERQTDYSEIERRLNEK